jgi:hypothetical protein
MEQSPRRPAQQAASNQSLTAYTQFLLASPDRKAQGTDETFEAVDMAPHNGIHRISLGAWEGFHFSKNPL